MIFCQASFNPDDQERTRFSVISPDMTQEKLGDSLDFRLRALGIGRRSRLGSMATLKGTCYASGSRWSKPLTYGRS